MRRLPIRLRLTVWYAVVFTLALAVFGVSVWGLVRSRLYDDVEDQLQAQVETVQRFMSAQKSDITPEHLREELQEEYETEDHATWLEVLDQDGNWMFRAQRMSEIAPSIEAPAASPAAGKFLFVRDGRFRVLMLQKSIDVSGNKYTVQVGAATNGIHHTLQQLRNVFLLAAPCFVLIAAVGSYYLSRRALRSVDEITAMARSIHEQNLDQRLPALRTNDELQRLSQTLNEMLARIEAAFTRTRQFTADASHELRTPVSLIRTEAELSLRRPRNEQEYRAALSHVLAESERMTELIENLLTLARTDSGREVVHLDRLQINEFLRRCADEWVPLMEASGLRIVLDVPEPETWVLADQRLLRRLMIVLLDNARKYTPEGGSIHIFGHTERELVQVGVTDTGIGIEPEHTSRIFDRFYRVDKARSRAEGGAGLGLSLARWIASQHGTEIRVDSTPGKGSTFSFDLRQATDDVGTFVPHSVQNVEKVS